MADIKKELKKIEKLKSNREYSKATEKIRELLKEYPDNFDLLWELASLYFDSDKEKTGVSTLRQILKLFPKKLAKVSDMVKEKWRTAKNPDALLWFLWELKINSHALDEAETVLTKMRKKDLKHQLTDYLQRIREIEKFKPDNELDKNDINLYYYAALLSLRLQNYKKALEFFKRITAIRPKQTNYVKKILEKEHETGVDNIDLILLLSGFYTDISNIAKAVDLLLEIPKIDEGTPPIAIQRLEAIEKDNPNNKKIMTGLAELNLSAGNIREAIRWLSKMLELFPANTDEILNKIDTIKEENPDETGIYLALVEVAINKENPIDAVENLKKAAKISKGVTSEILEYADKIKNKFPKNNNVRFLLVELYKNNNDISSALEQLNIIIEQDGHEWRGRAIDILLEIVKEDEANIQAHDMLGKIYVLENQFERATAVYDHLWENHPDSLDIVIRGYEAILKAKPSASDVAVSLSKAYIIKKDFQTAVVHLGDVLKHNPKKIKDIAPLLSDIIRKDHKQIFLIARLYESLSLKKEMQDDPDLALALAEAYSYEKKIDRATQQLQRVLVLAPSKTEAVQSIYKKILEDDPTQIECRLDLVNLYIKQNDLKNATDELVKIVASDEGHLQEVIENFYKILDKNDDLYTRKALINTFFNNKLWDHAAEECEKVIKASPFDESSSFAYLILAETYIEKGLYKDAVDKLFTVLNINQKTLPQVKEKCTRIVSLDEANVSARYTLAECNILEDNLDRAVDVLLEVLKYDKNRIDSIMEHIQRIINKKHTNVKAHLALGELHIYKNEFDKASREFTQALELDPSRLEEVIRNQKKILKLEPNSVIANFMLGKALIRKNEFAKAVEYLEKSRHINSKYVEPVMRELQRILSLAPHNPDAKIALGKIYVKKNLHTNAIQVLNQVVEQNPELTETVITLYKEIQEKAPEIIQLHLAMTKAYITTKNYEKAIEKIKNYLLEDESVIDEVIGFLEMIVSDRPSLSSAVTLLAECYIKKGDYDEASTHLMAVLNLDKKNQKAAMDGLNKILAIKPNHLMSRIHLGNLYFQIGNYEEAKNEFDTALGQTDDKQMQIELYLNLSNVCLAMNDEKKSKAYLYSARVLDPGNRYLYRQLEDLFYRQLSTKIENLEKTAKEEPQNYVTILELAKLYFQNGNFDKAMSALQFSTEDKSIEQQRICELGKLFIAQKDYYAAINVLSDIKILHQNLTTDEKEIFYWLAIAYEKVGKIDEALERLEKIYVCDPTYRDIKQRKNVNYLKKTQKEPTILIESI